MPAGMKGTRMANTSLRLPLEQLKWLTAEAEQSSPRVSRNTLIIQAVELLMERRDLNSASLLLQRQAQAQQIPTHLTALDPQADFRANGG